MAKLVVTKEKYGVSVGSRIAPELAQEIAAEASALGLSMAKMLSLIITRGFSDMKNRKPNDPETVEELQETIQQLTEGISMKEDELLSLKETYKAATAEFISSVSPDAESLQSNINIFNAILESKRHEDEG